MKNNTISDSKLFTYNYNIFLYYSGIFYYNDGNKYDGDVKNDIREGKGKLKRNL